MTKKLKSIAIILAVCSLFLVSPVFAGTCDVVCWESCSSCEPPEMNMNAIISKSILDYGESATITIMVQNNEAYADLDCQYKINSGEWSSYTTIPNDGKWYQLGQTTITAPTEEVSQQVSVDVVVTVHCKGEHWYIIGKWCGNGCKSKILTYTYPTYETIQKQQKRDNANTQINTAQNLINDAQSTISTAQNKINEAAEIGADVVESSYYLSQANAALENAQTYLLSAHNSYDNGDYDSAISYAQQAQNYANEAKNYANLAKTSAEEAIQQVSYEKTEASNKISAASSAIDNAQTAILSAQSKIQEALNVGADVIQANSYLASANTDLENAQTYLTQAKNAFNNKDYTSAESYAETAQQYAKSAKNNANLAKSIAEEAMKELVQKKTEVNNKISAASSAIDNARKAIKEAESLINNATVIGMDTTQAEADVATARSKLKSAEDYYSEAMNVFDAKNYDLAKEKALNAESYAKEAESLAISAYNSLWIVYSKKRVAAQAITNADSEVSKMIEINTKLAYILRNVKSYGVDITETQSVVDEAAACTDEAEDLLSQAKNRMASGYTEEAVSLAVQARDMAATAYNRLDTIVLKLKFNIQDALDVAYKEKQSNLEQARLEVQSTSQTYGIDNQLVIKAQQEISAAETTLKDAKSKIDAVETSKNLTELLTNAKAAFEVLEKVQQQIDKTKAYVNTAKMKLYQTIAVSAVGVAAIGGGFLYWRRKKKRIIKESEEEGEKIVKGETPKKRRNKKR